MFFFIKCIIFLTGKDYKEENPEFISIEKRLSNYMTIVRIQQRLRKLGIDFGSFKGKEICPRTKTKRNIGLYLYDNHFCLIWKSEGVSFKNVVKNEIKDNLKLVDNYITEEIVNSHFEDIFKPKKIECWPIL